MIGQLSYFKIAAFFSGIFIIIQPSLMPEQQPKWSSSKNKSRELLFIILTEIIWNQFLRNQFHTMIKYKGNDGAD